jgi:hypothetical protein
MLIGNSDVLNASSHTTGEKGINVAHLQFQPTNSFNISTIDNLYNSENFIRILPGRKTLI